VVVVVHPMAWVELFPDPVGTVVRVVAEDMVVKVELV
jgi:hypothetical protein